MVKMRIIAVLATIALCGWVSAEDAPKPAAPAAPTVIPAGDNDALKTAVDKSVTVEGTVASAVWASPRVFVIKFKDSEATHFQGVVFSKDKEAMEKGLGGELSAAVNGAKIQLNGKVVMYRDHPEIMLNEPKQVRIVVKGTGVATPTPAAPESARLSGPYAKLTLSDEQKQKIAAVEKETGEAIKAATDKLRAEADAKIDALLTAEQRKQLAEVKSQTKSDDKN